MHTFTTQAFSVIPVNLFYTSVHHIILHAIIEGVSGGKGEHRESLVHAGIDPIPVQADSVKYMYPFQNCTTMIFTNKNFIWETFNKPSSGPIIFLNYDTKITLATGGIAFRKFFVKTRRNYAPHCWATFTILPEKEYFSRDADLDFIGYKPCFIHANLWSQYFILVTAVPDLMNKYVKSEPVLSRLNLREVIIVDVIHFLSNDSKLRLNYHNIYYIMAPTVGMEHSEPWYQMECLSNDCHKQLTATGKNLSKLNKYFWAAYSNFGGPKFSNVRELFGPINVGRIQHSPNGYRRLANLTTFHGFLSFWILQDLIENNFTDHKPLYFIAPINRIGLVSHRVLNYVIYGVQSYSFVSCYEVSSNSDILNTLTSPLDGISWILLGTCFITVALLLTAVLSNYSTISSDRVILMVGLTLENAVLVSRNIYRAVFLKKRHESLGIYIIIAVWMILIGTILTNWYKSCFTIEMIIPKIYRSPWTSVMDVEGIRILMPFSLLNEDDFQIEPLVDYILYLSFYIRLFNLCLEKSLQNVTYKRLMTHQITATKLYNMLLPYFGLDVNMTPVGNGVFTSFIGKPPPYNKSALHDYPIQPIEYDKGDTFEILKTLSSCGKVALMDSKDNIDAITTFLNDNQQEIRYVKGHDDFFTEIKGWTLFPVRGSYAEKRLKLMISSGIFAHWELIYKLWKSKKLLNHYANRSQQAVPSDSKDGNLVVENGGEWDVLQKREKIVKSNGSEAARNAKSRGGKDEQNRNEEGG
ncbi:hypothetical protein Fcan01_18007 [Folsomia candida]|uniref:Uncharacterized protein n=1 Tax=Folsomia candida TaxID=158441 RepID=A0A226DSJ3_FOLCA|nr:hypothetical protein Fcan01_18007 [Folsomia candida]